MAKVSVNTFVISCVTAIRNEVKIKTLRLRNRTSSMLEETFKVAAKVARGEIRHQRINGKTVPISLNQWRRWARIAEHIAKTMNSIASNFNEREINLQVGELEKLSTKQTLTIRMKNLRQLNTLALYSYIFQS